ncbi:hypothetical protein HUS23_12705 [Ectothiorhodospiraceae bacterium 2226]|nr:hypothetical protein HUS23_12705 [Ectothiorhodospiraceae bacterium 2226]
MNGRYLATLTLVILMAGCTHGAHVAQQHPFPEAYSGAHPRAVVDVYLAAVDRGELRLFSHTLDRAMINPTRVEYAFELDAPTATVKVYSELRRPIAVPNQANCEIRAVSATLDPDGNIIETEAHIWQQQRIDC